MVANSSPSIDLAADKPPGCKRTIPVSLRMFVAIVLLLGAGVIAFVGIPVYREQTVIAEFDRLHVHYEKRPIGSARLQSFLQQWNFNVDRLPQEVVSVSIGFEVYPGDFDSGWFRSLPGLEKLRIRASWFGPVNLKFLAG